MDNYELIYSYPNTSKIYKTQYNLIIKKISPKMLIREGGFHILLSETILIKKGECLGFLNNMIFKPDLTKTFKISGRTIKWVI